MNTRPFVRFLRLVLALAVLLGTAVEGRAQTKAPVTPPPPGEVRITDAAGRVHVRSQRITYAQRKAAAERRVKAMRAAAAKKKLGEVKK